MQLINKIYVDKALNTTLLQENKFLQQLLKKYKASGTKLLKTLPSFITLFINNISNSRAIFYITKANIT